MLISLKEAAGYLGITPLALQKYVQRRLVPCYRFPKPTSRPKFNKEELGRWMETFKVEPTPQRPQARKVN